MKQHRLTKLLSLALLTGCSLVRADAVDHKTPLCIAVTGYHSSSPEQPGLSDIARKIFELSFKDSPYSIYFRTLPQKRALREVQTGKCDALGGATYDPSRITDYEFSDQAISTIEVVFFKLKERNFSWQVPEDLRGLVIGSGDGLEVPKSLLQSDLITLSNLSSGNKNIQNFLRLASGRIDLLVMPKLQGYRVINKLLSPEYKDLFDTVEKPLTTSSVHLMFSRNIEDLARKKAAFDQGLLAIKQDGTLNKILNEHVIELELNQ